MFLVLVVQCIEGGDSHLSVTHIARLRFLLPELIGPTDVEEVVAADMLNWCPHASGWYSGECEEEFGCWIVCCTDMEQSSFSTPPIVPVPPHSRVVLEARCPTSGSSIK